MPTVGNAIGQADVLLVYGPLGIMALIFLVLLGFLWKRYTGTQDKHAEQLAKLQTELQEHLREEREAFFDELHRRDAAQDKANREIMDTVKDLAEKSLAMTSSLGALVEVQGRRIKSAREGR